ncbi:hypothetical protein [Streptomyces canus]|uniref:hypothetical protein n=1 Tax=Streptomyces canus TaxID=58343 RepID=UPI00371B767C
MKAIEHIAIAARDPEGTTTGRKLRERAAGIDPTRVTTGAPPLTFSAEHHFVRDELGARLRG